MNKRFFAVAVALMLIFSTLLPAQASGSADALLTAIDSLAQHGWILNCAYRVMSDNLDDITDEYGEPDSDRYVASAKGSYAVYDAMDFVAGHNTGDTIFELRSFDKRLSRVRLKDVEAYYGSPDHKTKTSKEHFISYVLNDTVNIKFVFPASGSNPQLDHYCVIWLEGTENNRADDPGRDW